MAAGELVTLLGTGVEGYDIQLNSAPVQPISSKPGEVTLALPDTFDVASTVEIQMLSKGVPQARITAALAGAAVGVFSARIANDDGTLNAMDNPALRGGSITIYGTGEGRGGAGVTATLDGQPVDVVGFDVSLENPNVFVLVVQVPGGYFSAGAKALRVKAGASTSQANVTVYVR